MSLDGTFPSTLAESYTYDAGGNPLTKTDRKGQTVSYGYGNNKFEIEAQVFADQHAKEFENCLTCDAKERSFS